MTQREHTGSEPEEPRVLASTDALSTVTFDAGSLIIPMDTTYQNWGTLKAFGLVYKLIRSSVPVYWTIQSGKDAGGVDFVASGRDLWDGGVVTNNGYRGGPFVIDVADRTAAMPIIQAWHDAGNITTIHDVTSPFSAEVRRRLNAAPRIATFVDGTEIIAFNYLNAAGITDSDGGRWPTSTDPSRDYAGFPDVVNATAVKGDAGMNDGVLLRADGTPNYCQFTSMHYSAPADIEVVREVRRWLAASSVTHAFMECDAIATFENADGGQFLSTGGVPQDSTSTPSALTNVLPDNEFNQFDGTFQPTPGSLRSLGTRPGSSWRPGTQTLLNRFGTPLDGGIVWMTGHLDGDPAMGKVTYLTGHLYPTSLPISTNPRTNGVRLFLDSLFESACASDIGQPSLTLTKSAPLYTDGGTITFAITYHNDGPGIADNAALRDAIPSGTTFVSATGGGTFTDGGVTWSLGNLRPDAGGTVSLSVAVTSDGPYVNRATMNYRMGLTAKTLDSNETTTIRDTATPDTTIVTAPPAQSSSSSASFTFTSTASGATFECRLDEAASFTTCSNPATFSSLTDGAHTLAVRAKAPDGAVDPTPATWAWTVVAPSADAGQDAGTTPAVDGGTTPDLDADSGVAADASAEAADAGVMGAGVVGEDGGEAVTFENGAANPVSGHSSGCDCAASSLREGRSAVGFGAVTLVGVVLLTKRRRARTARATP